MEIRSPLFIEFTGVLLYREYSEVLLPEKNQGVAPLEKPESFH